MTLNDIKRDVSALGFESDIALDSTFKGAVERALATIYTERGVHGRVQFYQKSPIPICYVECIEHIGGEDYEIELFGRTYALRASGVGNFTVSDESGTKSYSFNADSAYFSAEVKGVAKIRFTGEFCYTVYHFTVFSECFPEGHAPFEYGRWREYDMTLKKEDYLGAASLPTDKNGDAIIGAAICTGKLKIPYGYVGEVNLNYRKKAPRISIDYPDEPLDICCEVEHLVALLTASYAWLDDDAEKAQYYLSLYRDGMAAVKLYDTRCLDNNYVDTTGWA